MNRGLGEAVVHSEQSLAGPILNSQTLKSMVSDKYELMTVATPVFRHSSRMSSTYFTARHPCLLLLSFCRVMISHCPGIPFLVGSYLALSVLVELIFPNN